STQGTLTRPSIVVTVWDKTRGDAMNAKVGAWLGVTGLGLIFLFSGITDHGGNSQPGLIVFGALIVPSGVSALLGIGYKPNSSGFPYALCGLFIPGWSLPFLLFGAMKGASDRAEDQARRARERRQEHAELDAGVRCPHCGLLDEGRHKR